MKKLMIAVFSVLVFAIALAVAGEIKEYGLKPKEGFVPDAKTAIKIAVAVWELIYGEKQIASEKPYRAKLLTNSVWIVRGSLPEGWLGGVAEAEIAKEDGRILRVSHGR